MHRRVCSGSQNAVLYLGDEGAILLGVGPHLEPTRVVRKRCPLLLTVGPVLVPKNIDQVIIDTLCTEPIILPGDFNEDGDVDAFDFADWQANYPTASGATRAMGDSNGDGDVDAFDFGEWQADYPYPPPSEPAPEPATLGLMLIGRLVLIRRRREAGF